MRIVVPQILDRHVRAQEEPQDVGDRRERLGRTVVHHGPQHVGDQPGLIADDSVELDPEFRGQMVDENLDRPSDVPTYWTDAAPTPQRMPAGAFVVPPGAVLYLGVRVTGAVGLTVGDLGGSLDYVR